MPTIYELAARSKKAERLATTLLAAGIDAVKARRMDAGHWLVIARDTGVRVPSAETQALVIEILTEQEAVSCVAR